MPKDSDPTRKAAQTRDEQLAVALRANLRRRKAAGANPAPKPPEKKADREG